MNTSESTATPAHVDEVVDWLIERVAEYREIPAADVDPDVPLAELGLDSVYVLSLCGDVEDHYGLVVEPTVAWDHPTVDALAKHLHAELTGGAS
ncbi:acyl carrier protein [Streptomyces alkaliterrae]|uniref:Acyl carrier protein n=1 Tax=Streptomyces alkaliterrae TaxID=2213162 RepID=A0A5P0YPR9_9ACTN|nr:acyl carrier protein [Streptomyces alkaliterrae]MBB1253130.1 acyl carrier protein [Streptomyces alkaliterrae]MBB1259110.1 acyl carrier protein [Streptomyces alkaliterrae]MQS02255.1 acyl carrier protein [Streptomyces alkaliterrae]